MASSSALKRKLSGSTDGMPILITATSSPGTTIDTAVAGTTDGTYDETYLWASNIYSEPVILILEIGDAGAQIIISIDFKTGDVPIRPGLLLQNSQIIKAFASVASVIYIDGYKNRITD